MAQERQHSHGSFNRCFHRVQYCKAFKRLDWLRILLSEIVFRSSNKYINIPKNHITDFHNDSKVTKNLLNHFLVLQTQSVFSLKKESDAP